MKLIEMGNKEKQRKKKKNNFQIFTWYVWRSLREKRENYDLILCQKLGVYCKNLFFKLSVKDECVTCLVHELLQ